MRDSVAFIVGAVLAPGIALVYATVRMQMLSYEQPVKLGGPVVFVIGAFALAAWAALAATSFLFASEYARYARDGAPQVCRGTRLALLAGIALGLGTLTLPMGWIGLLVFAALGPVFFRTQSSAERQAPNG